MLEGKLKTYLLNQIPDRSPFFQEMEQYAAVNKVPIMDPLSMETLLQLLRLYKPKNILEIGAAIGYSSLRIANATDAKIVTVERDENRIRDAHYYIGQAGKSEQIYLLEGDALEMFTEVQKFAPYDCLFIDAAKSQYQKFFELFEELLAKNAIVITDNVLFKGLVYEEGDNNRLNTLGKKINGYNDWLIQNQSYHTVILPVGDGMAISIKK